MWPFEIVEVKIFKEKTYRLLDSYSTNIFDFLSRHSIIIKIVKWLNSILILAFWRKKKSRLNIDACAVEFVKKRAKKTKKSREITS